MKSILRAVLITGMFIFSVTACNQRAGSDADGGLHEAVSLLSDSTNKASCVYMTTDEKNNPIVSWIEENKSGEKIFLFARWDERNNTFEKSVEIPIAQNAAIHEEGMPKNVAKADGNLVAIYEVTVPQPGQKWGVSDISWIQSNDGGASWSQPNSVNSRKSNLASLSFSGIARLSDGEIGVAWLDANPAGPNQAGRPVMFARTRSNNGFSDPVLIDSVACECCKVAVAAGGSGMVAVAYRDLSAESIRDISISISNDNGKSFTKPENFSNDQWQIDGCPHNGPSVSIDEDKIFATWYSGGSTAGVHYAELDNKGNLMSKKELSRNARFAHLAVLADGSSIVAYNESYKDGDSVYSRIDLDKISKEGVFKGRINSPEKHGNFPMIQALGKYVIVAWSDSGKIYYTAKEIAAIDEKTNQYESQPPVSPAKRNEELHREAH